MKRILFVLLAMTMVVTSTWAKKDETPGYDYELSMIKAGVATTSGFKVFKVWSYATKKDLLTQEICMRNAVHGILFKGLVAPDEGAQGSIAPLVPAGYESHKEYFDTFFNSGEYKQFIQVTSRGAQGAGDVLQLSKKRWKVGLAVQVNIKGLRQRLEKDRIIDSAKNIFSR